MNLLIFGSSITWGAWDSEGGWATRLKKIVDQKVIASNYQEYHSVYCLGISGNTSNHLLNRFEQELLARIDPDDQNIILVEIGINDTLFNNETNTHWVPIEIYEDNLKKIIHIAKSHQTQLIFIGLTPVDKRVDPVPWVPTSSYRQRDIKNYEAILEMITKENNIPIINILDIFPENKLNELLSDGLHPNSIGHKLIFERIKQYIETNYLNKID